MGLGGEGGGYDCGGDRAGGAGGDVEFFDSVLLFLFQRVVSGRGAVWAESVAGEEQGADAGVVGENGSGGGGFCAGENCDFDHHGGDAGGRVGDLRGEVFDCIGAGDRGVLCGSLSGGDRGAAGDRFVVLCSVGCPGG